MTICSAVLIECQRVTDRQTDGRTDVKPIAITCFSIADACKKEYICIAPYLGKPTSHLRRSGVDQTVFTLLRFTTPAFTA